MQSKSDGTKIISRVQKGIYVSYVWKKSAPTKNKSPYLCMN